MRFGKEAPSKSRQIGAAVLGRALAGSEGMTVAFSRALFAALGDEPPNADTLVSSLAATRTPLELARIEHAVPVAVARPRVGHEQVLLEGPQRGELSVDLMRHRSDGPKVMDFLFVSLFLRGKVNPLTILLSVSGARLEIKQNARISTLRVFRLAGGAGAAPKAAKPAKARA